MNLTKTHWMIIGVFAVIAVWYFFLRKKDTKESGFKKKSKSRAGIRKCFCPSSSASGYGWKYCSESVLCTDCCAGTGEGDVRE